MIELALPANGSVFQKARYLNNKVTLEFRLLVYQLNQHTIDIAYEALAVNKQAGDMRQIANTWFQLGFTLLWSNKIEESIRVFEEHWPEIKRVGDKVIATRGITYFYIAYRRAGNVDRAEELVNEYLYSGDYPPVPEYLFAANSTLVWINWKRKNYRSMEDHYVRAMQILKPVNLFTPFHFLYVMPMVDWYLQTNALDKVNPLLKDLTLAHQRKLEPDLRAIIDKCLANGENGVPDTQLVKMFLDLASQYKYL